MVTGYFRDIYDGELSLFMRACFKLSFLPTHTYTRKQELSYTQTYALIYSDNPLLTWQVVQHVGEQFWCTIWLIVDVHKLLLQRIAHQTEYDQMEELADFIWQHSQKVIVQQQLPVYNK